MSTSSISVARKVALDLGYAVKRINRGDCGNVASIDAIQLGYIADAVFSALADRLGPYNEAQLRKFLFDVAKMERV